MGKVTFEYDENEESYELDLIHNRHKMAYALSQLRQLRRTIYKGYNSRYIVVKEDKVVYRDGEKLQDYEIDGAKCYIEDSIIIQELDDIIDEVSHIIDC